MKRGVGNKMGKATKKIGKDKSKDTKFDLNVRMKCV